LHFNSNKKYNYSAELRLSILSAKEVEILDIFLHLCTVLKK